MLRIFFLTLITLSFSSTSFAQNAKEIVKKSDEKLRGLSSQSEMTMQIVRPKWTRTMTMKSWSKSDQYAMILITSPAKDKGTVFLKRQNEMWQWIPKVSKTIKMPPSMMLQSWMGSDFKNDDLVKQSSMVADYTHTMLGEEKIGDYDCYKIKLTPKANAPVVWGKIIIWISKKDYLQMKAKFYDEDSELVQTFYGKDVKNLGGKLLPSKLVIIPTKKKSQKTIITYKSLKFNVQIAESFFSIQNMKKVQ